MMRRGADSPDATEAGALALQRVLALEGRNALARVELAASELSRLEASPAYRDRIVAIRDAVDELDAVLDKIERLSDPLRGSAPGAAAQLEPIWGALAERIAPALAARGVVLTWESGWSEAPLALTGPVLERLLLAGLRVAVGAVEDSVSETTSDAIVLSVACRERASSLEWIVSVARPASDRRLLLERSARIELEVALGEWRAELIDETSVSPSGFGMRFRKCDRHA